MKNWVVVGLLMLSSSAFADWKSLVRGLKFEANTQSDAIAQCQEVFASDPEFTACQTSVQYLYVCVTHGPSLSGGLEHYNLFKATDSQVAYGNALNGCESNGDIANASVVCVQNMRCQ